MTDPDTVASRPAIRTADTKVDSYYDQPVFLDETYVLLAPEIKVSQELLDRLRRWSFSTIHTSGSALGAADCGEEVPGSLEQSIAGPEKL